MSNPRAAIDLLTDSWAGVLIDVLTIGALAEVGLNVPAGVMLGVGVNILTEFESMVAFSCWPMAVLNRNRVLHARMPSTHVCSRFELPALLHFLNQEPPRPQQLILPDLSTRPHLGHTGPIVVVTAVGG